MFVRSALPALAVHFKIAAECRLQAAVERYQMHIQLLDLHLGA